MRKYWHRVDEIFGKAQEAYQDVPSAANWEKISGALDRGDAEAYKEKYLLWKRASLTLLLLLSFALYEITSVQVQKKSSLASIGSAPNKKADLSIGQPTLNARVANDNSDPSQSKTRTEYFPPDLFGSANEPQVASPIAGRELNLALQYNPVPEQINPATKNIFSNKSSGEAINRNISAKFIDPDNINPTRPKWTLSAFASSEWAGYRLDNDPPNNIASSQNQNKEDEADLINARERHQSSYSTGIFVSRQLDTKWGLKSGLIFSQTSISIIPQEIYATQTPDGSMAFKYVMSSGYIYVKPNRRRPIMVGDSIKSAAAQHQFTTLTLPMMVSRYFTKGRVTLIPSVGISLNYITRARFETELQTRRRTTYVFLTRLEGMKDFYVGALGDMDIRYAIGSRWSISMLPSFRYALTPITKDNVVRTFPYSFSLGGALSYTF
jgi:hypothetical protein